MRIDAINMNAFTGTTRVQDLKAEETNNSSLDEYDDTRVAANVVKHDESVSLAEDILNQKSTEKMAQSYGFANVAEAQAATTPTASTEASSAVSPVSGVSAGGINA